MLRFMVLASGSSGNVSAVWNGSHGLLIDAGTGSSRAIERTLASADLNPAGIAGILVTHAHSDHFGRPVRVLARKYRAPVITHRDTYAAACRRSSHFSDLEPHGLMRFIEEHKDHLHHNFEIRAWPVPHGGYEAGRPLAYTIRCGGRSIFYATDLGRVPPYLVEAMRQADLVLLESNYDPDMERDSGRPQFLKDWVMGGTGHLSNGEAAEALERVYAPGHGKYPKRVVLGHLSEDCNHPEKAMTEVRRRVPAHAEVHVAARHERSQVWEI